MLKSVFLSLCYIRYTNMKTFIHHRNCEWCKIQFPKKRTVEYFVSASVICQCRHSRLQNCTIFPHRRHQSWKSETEMKS